MSFVPSAGAIHCHKMVFYQCLIIARSRLTTSMFVLTSLLCCTFLKQLFLIHVSKIFNLYKVILCR